MLARAGYAAKGIVYVAIGCFSAAAAFHVGGGGAANSREALTQMANQPFGVVALWAVALGLVGYVVWRLVQAFLDPEHRGTDAKGLATRGLLVGTAVVYGGLALWAFQRLLDGSAGNGTDSAATAGNAGSGRSGTETWSAELLSQPFGRWLLAAFALAVIAYGFVEMVKAWRASFERKLRRDLTGDTRRAVRKIAWTGLVARGIVFWIVGGFLLYAAWTADPARARGLEGALDTLSRQPYGPYLMGLVAVGLVAYGVLQLAKAWYQRIGPIH